MIYFSCKRIFMKYILCSSLFISSRFLSWVYWACLQYEKWLSGCISHWKM